VVDAVSETPRSLETSEETEAEVAAESPEE
jgi:hypothetical protein